MEIIEEYLGSHFEDFAWVTDEICVWMLSFEFAILNNSDEMAVIDPVNNVIAAKGMKLIDMANYLTIRGLIPDDIKGVSYHGAILRYPYYSKKRQQKIEAVRIRAFLDSNNIRKSLDKGEIPCEYGEW